MTSFKSERDNEVRVVEAAPPQTRYARGWHGLGLADEFRDGKPHSIAAFGTKLVVFADSSGKLNVLNAYCPHMGGDLSQGTVKGDDVACPFHDWRWSGSGRCSNIPYARRVPPRARTQAWTTLERNGVLLVWNDPQGNPPPPEVTIPEIPGYGTSEWTPWRWNSLVIENSHSRELVDNLVDMAHFFYVHFAFPVYFRNVFEGHVAAQYSSSKLRQDTAVFAQPGDRPNRPSRAEAVYYGPAYLVDKETIPTDDGELTAILLTCHYQITPTSFMMQWGVMVQKPTKGTSEERALAIGQEWGAGVEKGLLQDLEIWKNKTKIDNPLLCDEDGPVYQLRRWYEQFYVDVEDVTPEMTQRFEFEIDTERANAAWTKEVEDNIAAGRRVAST